MRVDGLRKRAAIITACLMLVGALGAQTALAATQAYRDGSVLRVHGDGSSNRLKLDRTAAGELRVTDQTGSQIAISSTCRRGSSASTVLCNPAGLATLEARLGAGRDAFWNGADMHALILGESGDDDTSISTGIANPASVSGLVGGGRFDQVEGGPGNDVIRDIGGDSSDWVGAVSNLLSGGDGNDHVHTAVYGNLGGSRYDEEAQNNWVFGGANNDHLTASESYDTIDGGSGTDTIKAGAGWDTVYSLDNERDTVDCAHGYFDDAYPNGSFDKHHSDTFDQVSYCNIAF